MFDGWRPRWVDEDLSVELKWIGRDSVERSRKGIPVSDAFAAKILSGTKVQLVDVQVHVIDDDTSLPVIDEDVNDRIRHIASFSDIAKKGFILFGCAFLVSVAWGRFSSRRQLTSSQEQSRLPKRPVPYVLVILTTFLLGAGILIAIYSWNDQRSFQQIQDHGESVIADITRAHAEIAKAGEPPSFLVDLAWRDSLGQQRAYGPTHISTQFWNQITRNGILTKTQTKIYYLTSDADARPIIADDVEERRFQDSMGVKAGLVFIVFGLLLGTITAYRMRA